VAHRANGIFLRHAFALQCPCWIDRDCALRILPPLIASPRIYAQEDFSEKDLTPFIQPACQASACYDRVPQPRGKEPKA
jgi:hypothetical protein